MKSRDKLFSVENEVAVHPELNHERGVLEQQEAAREEPSNVTSAYYSSVAFEPGSQAQPSEKYQEMLREETKGCSVPRAWGTTVLCGVVGGIFAVPAVFLQGKQSFFTLLMLVIVGPFIEESVKQSGMIYQMEKRPASICHDGQFFLAAVLGGLTFSILENLLYKHVYLANLPPDELTEIMKFRWMECTLMHIAAPLVSAFGLRNVWKESRAEGRPCKVERAFPWFVGAMCLHGLYNFLALLFQNWLFK